MANISDILRDRNALENRAYQIRHDKRHPIHIQYMNTMLMPFIEAFIHDHHEVTLDISCHELEEIYARVRAHEIDAGFIAINDSTQSMTDDLLFTPVCTTRLVILCSDEHPFTKLDRPVTMDDLKSQRFCIFNDSSHDIIFDHLQMRCGPLRLVLRTDDSILMNRTMRELKCISFGRIMQGHLSTEPQLMEHIKLVPLDHVIDDHFTLGWLTNPNYAMSEMTKSYLDDVTERIQKEDE